MITVGEISPDDLHRLKRPNIISSDHAKAKPEFMLKAEADVKMTIFGKV